MFSDSVTVTFTKQEQGALEIAVPAQIKPWDQNVQLRLVSGKAGSSTTGNPVYEKVLSGTKALGAKVTSDGLVTASGPGNVVVKATKQGNDKYNAKESKSVTVRFDRANFPDSVQGKKINVAYTKGATYDENALLGFIDHEPTGTSIASIKLKNGKSVSVNTQSKTVSHAGVGTSTVEVTLQNPKYNSKTVAIEFIISPATQNKPGPVRLSQSSVAWGTGISIRNYDANNEYRLVPPTTNVRINAHGVINATAPYVGIIKRQSKSTNTHSKSLWSDDVTVIFTKQEQGALEIAAPAQIKPWNSGGVQLNLVLGKEGIGSGNLTYEKVSSGTTALGAGVTSAGVVTASGPGNVVVKATKRGDDKYNAKESNSVTVTFDRANFLDSVQGRTERVAYKAGETYNETALLGLIDGEPTGTSIASIKLKNGKSVSVNTRSKTVSHVQAGTSTVEVTLQNPKYNSKPVEIQFIISPATQNKPGPVRLSQSSVAWGTDVRINDYEASKYEYELQSTSGGVKRNGQTISAKGGPGTATIRRRLRVTSTHSKSLWSDRVTVTFTKQEQGALEIAVPVQGTPWGQDVHLSLAAGKKGRGNGVLVYEKVSSGTTALGAGVTSVGVVTASGPGYVVVKATKQGNDKYNAKESNSVTVRFDRADFLDSVQGRTERVAYKAGETYNETALLGLIDGEPTGTSIASIKLKNGKSVSVNARSKTVSHVQAGTSTVEVTLQNPKYNSKPVEIQFIISLATQNKPGPVRLSQSSVAWGTRISIGNYDANNEYSLVPPNTNVRINAHGEINATAPYKGEIEARVRQTQTHGASDWSDRVNVEFTKQDQGELEIAPPVQGTPWGQDVQLRLVSGKAGSSTTGNPVYEKVSSRTTALGAVVTSAGVVMASGPGNVVVKATKRGDDKYNAKESNSVTVRFDRANFRSNVQGRTERVAYKAGETYNETALLGLINNKPTGTSIASIRLTSGTSVSVNARSKTVSHAGVGTSTVVVELSNPNYNSKPVAIEFIINPATQKKPGPVTLSQSKVAWGTAINISGYDANKYKYEIKPDSNKIAINHGVISATAPYVGIIKRQSKSTNTHSKSVWSDGVKVEFTKAKFSASVTGKNKVVKYTGNLKKYDEKEILKDFIDGEPGQQEMDANILLNRPVSPITDIVGISISGKSVRKIENNGVFSLQETGDLGKSTIEFELAAPNYENKKVRVEYTVERGTMSAVKVFDYTFNQQLCESSSPQNFYSYPSGINLSSSNNLIKNVVKNAPKDTWLLIMDSSNTNVIKKPNNYNIEVCIGSVGSSIMSGVLVHAKYESKNIRFKLTIQKYKQKTPARPAFMDNKGKTRYDSSVSTQESAVALDISGKKESDGYEYEFKRFGRSVFTKHLRKVFSSLMPNLLIIEVFDDNNNNNYSSGSGRDYFSATAEVRVRKKGTSYALPSDWSSPLTIRFIPRKKPKNYDYCGKKTTGGQIC